ncbi:DNA-formamidopyrimidine glycosylase [Mangrovibacillus cuniculi]|uniref:Formamidopyrimidine-DNA glycosylase n=1 Tax=Mangrovibacillus cuniculi TaxID=2593652 RepID=A0A7S8HG86_9BACI|nr:DNA-formamidopyrimidine glycosylase [Mangrovibacillus cuniculi]QPC47195.1 DNA-formamidopyrimidine glycosylase [Mangrovibacillus cuniculi]
MPELPEVETARRTLLHLVQGKKVQSVDVRWPKIVKEPELDLFRLQLDGEVIETIERRGKFLLFELSNWTLISHLRMEGKFSVHDQGDKEEPHTHVVFTFTDGTELRYRDVRKFGTMHLVKKGMALHHSSLVDLGPEPFSALFQPEVLQQAFEKTSRSIKAVLLDQKAVVGLGNIYVDEALFRAKIHPLREAKSLTEKEIALLYQEIIDTLQEAVELGGSTIRTYVNSQGKIGTFQKRLYVYGRTGEPCLVCGKPIEKIKVAGRGTHICLSCQIVP